MRTLVVSDLHLGSAGGTDVLRRPGPLGEFCASLPAFDRLVLLGDTLELRHGPARYAVAAAEPVFAALGEALGPDGEIVLVGGNHDHGLLAPWLRSRGARRRPAPLALDEATGPRASPAVGRLARAAGPAHLTVRYPGLWIREDVYATHGHYLDCLTTLPAFERLAAGVMSRITGRIPCTAATPDDFEAVLGPIYAWMDALAETRGGTWTHHRQGASASTWEILRATGRRPLKARALAGLFPLGVRGLNRLGIGPLRAAVSGEALRDSSLIAMGEALAALGVRTPHVLFGHTHRAGPLRAGEGGPWVTASGTRLINAGCWVDEPVFARGGPASPYWAGRAIEVEQDPSVPPRLVRVVTELRPAVVSELAGHPAAPAPG